MGGSATWRLITTWEAPPGFNMGLDQALLEAAGPPTVRFYSWRPQAISLGYFQRLEDVEAARGASQVLRRITGGGAICHTSELTYSLTADRSEPVFDGNVADSYRRIHAAIAQALFAFRGISATLRGDSTLLSDQPSTGMCFHHSTPLDLCWTQRKGAGSAQRRIRGRVLHHGSIKLGPNDSEKGIATLAESDSSPAPQELAPHLKLALENCLGARLVAAAPEAWERDRARKLTAHYLNLAQPGGSSRPS
jgi:lipoate-protein ligase A